MATAAEHFGKHKHNVEQMLKKYPSARRSDQLLYLAYLEDICGLSKAIGAKPYLKLLAFFRKNDVPSMDTVGRIRRKFQEQGQYTVPNDTRKKYEKKFKEAVREF